MSNGTRVTRERQLWIDVARGLAMFLVVLMHFQEWHYHWLGYNFRGQYFVDALITVVGPVRMPLFFLLSGLLANGSLDRAWGLGGWKRVVNPCYLYVLWLLLYAALSLLLPADSFAMHSARVTDVARQLFVPDSALWYLLALALYFFLAKFLRRMNSALLIFLAALLSIATATAGLPPEAGYWDSIGKNLVFFLLGAYAASHVRDIAVKGRIAYMVPISVLYSTVLASVLVGPVWPGRHALEFVASLLGIWLVLKTAYILAKLGIARWTLGAVGRNTLLVFLLQAPIISAMNWIMAHHAGDRWAAMLAGSWWGPVYPFVGCCAIILLSLLIQRLIGICRLTFLLSPPGEAFRAIAPRTIP